MEADANETVGLGQMVDKVAGLALAGAAGFGLLELPKGALPAGLTVDDPRLIVLRDGNGKVELKTVAPLFADLLGKPARRKGTATATTLASFCELVNHSGDDGTVIFVDANWTAPKLTAVLNYNLARSDGEPQPAEEAGDDPLARFGDHRVVYPFPLSEPWNVWVANNGKLMPQEEFAAFIEDHIHEVAAPDTDPDNLEERRWADDFRTRIAHPSELVDLARGLEIMVGAKIKTQARLQSGERSLVFETEHRNADGGEVTVPGLFILRVPIFYEGLPQRMLVRLRYRAAGEKGVLWAYEIHRPDEVVTARVRADVREVEHRTGRAIFDGAPEA